MYPNRLRSEGGIVDNLWSSNSWVLEIANKSKRVAHSWNILPYLLALTCFGETIEIRGKVWSFAVPLPSFLLLRANRVQAGGDDDGGAGGGGVRRSVLRRAKPNPLENHNWRRDSLDCSQQQQRRVAAVQCWKGGGVVRYLKVGKFLNVTLLNICLPVASSFQRIHCFWIVADLETAVTTPKKPKQFINVCLHVMKSALQRLSSGCKQRYGESLSSQNKCPMNEMVWSSGLKIELANHHHGSSNATTAAVGVKLGSERVAEWAAVIYRLVHQDGDWILKQLCLKIRYSHIAWLRVEVTIQFYTLLSLILTD